MFERPDLYNVDCMAGMKEFPDKFFDLAIVDPPYGINADLFSNGSGASKDKGEYGTAVRLRKERRNDGSWDSATPSEAYFEELRRVSKNQVIWGGNYFPLPPTRGILVWDKKQPWESFSQVEIAWTSFDRPAGMFSFANTRSGKIHPTQKPVELYSWVLRRCAKDGDKILDTHAGSASSLIACYYGGYDAWGFEIDEEYYLQAKKRLEQAKQQVSMFELI